MVSFLAEVKFFSFWPKTMDLFFLSKVKIKMRFQSPTFHIHAYDVKACEVVILSLGSEFEIAFRGVDRLTSAGEGIELHHDEGARCTDTLEHD